MEGDNVMQIITFANLKGGVGKTMVTYNIGGFLAKQGHSVLLIDADIQANLTENCGFAPLVRPNFVGYDADDDWDDIDNNPPMKISTTDEFKTFSHLLWFQSPPDEVIKVVAKKLSNSDGGGSETIENLYIIPTDISLFAIETDIKQRYDAYYNLVLKNWIEENKEILEANFDYILIDVGPYMSPSTVNAFTASDDIILITDLTVNAYQGMKTLYQNWLKALTMGKKPFNMRGIIINRYDTRAIKYVESNENFLKTRLKSKYIKTFKNPIHESVPFKRTETSYPIAFTKNKKIIESPAYKSFENLIKEMKEGGFLHG